MEFLSSSFLKKHLDLTREAIWEFGGCSYLTFEFLQFHFVFKNKLLVI